MTLPDPRSEGPPPLGSWSRFYALVAFAAVVVLLLLYWFTTAFNIPVMPS